VPLNASVTAVLVSTLPPPSTRATTRATVLVLEVATLAVPGSAS
jgi:hypothetical protein